MHYTKRNIITFAIDALMVSIMGAGSMLAVACLFSADAREVFGKLALSAITLHNMF